MDKFLKSTLLFISLLLLPGMATAEDLYFKPYLGGGLGGFLLSNGAGDNWVFGGYGSVGAEVLPILAFEGRVGSAANASNATSTFGIDYFIAGYAKPQYKIEGMKINIYGLFGVSSVSSWSKPTGGLTVTRTVQSFSYGAGVEFYATDNIILGVEGMVLDGQDKSALATYHGNYAAGAVGTIRISF